jgi:hypothetical protein
MNRIQIEKLNSNNEITKLQLSELEQIIGGSATSDPNSPLVTELNANEAIITALFERQEYGIYNGLVGEIYNKHGETYEPTVGV